MLYKYRGSTQLKPCKLKKDEAKKTASNKMMQFTVFSASTLKLNKHLTRSITNQIYKEKNYGKKLYLSQFNKQASKLKRVRENFNFF